MTRTLALLCGKTLVYHCMAQCFPVTIPDLSHQNVYFGLTNPDCVMMQRYIYRAKSSRAAEKNYFKKNYGFEFCRVKSWISLNPI